MPFLLYPLIAGSAGFAIGLFTGDAMSDAFKVLIFVVIGLWLAKATGVMK